MTTPVVTANLGSGAITVIAGASVSGATAEGILAQGNGAVTLQVADVVTGGTNGASVTGNGAISVTGAGGFVGQNGAGLTIQNNGAATTVVDISGAVVATGGDGIQVRDAAVGTGVSVTTGAVTALSAGQSGVDAVSFSLTGDLTVVTNGDVAADNGGVVAALFAGAGTGNVSVTTNGAASGRFGIDAENQGSGSVTVTAVGPVTGGTGGGVFALTGGGDITVATGDVTATGATGITAFQFLGGGAGDISLTTNGDVSGTFGIQAINNGSGGVTVSAGGAVTGATAVGIELTGNAAVTLQVADVVTGAVEGAAITGSGPVSVTGAGGFVGQSGAGLTIQNNGAAATLVNVAGAVSATNGDGINIRDVAGGTGVSVTTGAVTALTAGRDGIDVSSLSLTGDVTVVTNGDVTGASGAIRAALTDAASTGDVIVTANGALGGGTGVQAQTAGSGAVSVTAIGPIAVSGSGVTAQTQGGDVSIATGAIDAGFIGVFAQQNDAAGVGDISVATNGAVSGLRGIQITNAGSGDITVTSNSTVTANGGFGLSAIGNGAVTLQVADTVSGTFGGMQLQAGGDISITGAGGFVGQGTGMFILSTGAGEININLAGPIVSANNTGLIIIDGLTGGDVNVTTGAVTATGGPFGRTALDLLSGSLTADVTVVTNGAVTASGTGISAGLLEGGATGDVRVTSNGAINTGTGSGIIASNNGAGSITINAVGPIVSTSGRGILLTSRQGDVSVTAGSVTAAAFSAIEARQFNAAASGDISVTVNGAVSGLNGIRIDTLGSGDVTLLNTAGGSITGTANSVLSAQAGGAFRLTNAGTINGRLTISGSAVAGSLVTNSATGVINTGAGASSVSGSLANAGIVNVAAGGSLAFLGGTTNTGRINLAAAGSFSTNGAMANSGVLNAQNGVVGNVITVGGSYSGGGQLLVDYSTATATADRLVIGGAATGVTNVGLNRVGPRTLVAGGFLPIVTVAGAASDNAFTSNTALFAPGFILDSFGRNPANTTQFGLIQSINPDSTSLAALSYVAEAASGLVDEPISAMVLGQGGERTMNFWIRGGTGETRQAIDTTIVGGGLSFAGAEEVETTQQVLQVGADFAVPGLGGFDLHLGLTGGVYDGDSRSLGADHVAVDGTFLGGYVVVGAGGFTVDASVRKEWREFDLYLPQILGLTGENKLDGEATAASVHAAYRFGGATGWTVTPFAGFDYADSEIDTLQLDPATTYSAGGSTTQVGQLGLRLAWRSEAVGPVVLEPFASVAALKNWSDDDDAAYVFNAPVTTFAQETTSWDDAIRYSVGVTGGTPDGLLSGFLVGTVDDGSRREGYSVSAGLRVSF
ncbi:MAG: autotransporter outer membrane beta-barrel domain-containing protein [Caulobacteraceae bacterium]|nr:MAG: autotransporter outer membrane beta-barrel domain-containing protein [Caulobacteraceae bacterium]